jgi:acetyl-CoA decarbonylase/synthase complex subunit delta
MHTCCSDAEQPLLCYVSDGFGLIGAAGSCCPEAGDTLTAPDQVHCPLHHAVSHLSKPSLFMLCAYVAGLVCNMFCAQPQVQQLAAAALKLLTGEEVQVSAAPAAGKKSSRAAPAAAAKAPMMDLLIDDTPSTSEPAGAPAAPASGIDLLGDLAGAAPAAAPAAAGAGGDLFDGLGVHAAAPAAAGASSSGDMFGGLTVDPAAAAAAPAAAAAAPAALVAGVNKSAPLDDLFAGLSTGPAANSSSSLIGGLPSPQPLQHQQQLGAIGAVAQLQQQQPPMQQQDWLGGDLGVPGPKMQQPGPNFAMQVGLLAARMLA